MVICEPEITVTPRQENDDFIMLACDGIWDCKTSEEGIDYMKDALSRKKTTEPISSCIEQLFEDIIATDILSSAGIGTDNMTCIVVKF